MGKRAKFLVSNRFCSQKVFYLSLMGCFFLALEIFVGCASAPETHYYDIQLSMASIDSQREHRNPDPLGDLHLLEVAVPDHLDEPRIFYRSSRYEAGHYEYHRWIRPLSQALAQELLSYFRGSGLFHNLYGPEDPILPGACQLRIKVKDLNEVDQQNEEGTHWKVQANVELHFSDPLGGNLRTLGIIESQPVRNRTAKGVVESINTALDRAAPRILEKTAEFIRSLEMKRNKEE